MPDLRIDGLTVERDHRVVLKECSARFDAGRRTVLWGASGSGKSTLLAAIAGLVTPSSGSISLGNELWFATAARVNLAPHRRHIGFVFQDLALWPHLTAFEQVAVVGREAGHTPTEARELLDSVGLAGLQHRRPGQLSGGEQQRLAMARALAAKPAILLLDEPFSSVDRPTRATLYALLAKLSPQIPGPTIYVTHHASDATSLAEAVVTLADGRLAPGERPWEEET